MRSAFRTAQTLLVLLLALCASPLQPQSALQASSSDHAPSRRTTVIGVPNFSEVTPKLFRGGQPTGKGYANLKKMGVDIVVDLRLSGKEREEQIVTQAGMKFVSIPWHCLYPRDHIFAKFLTILREHPDKKVFVHCRYGDDRTGMMIAAYRMAVQGWSSADAAKEMKKFGYHRTLCPSLAYYEESFPKRLQKEASFEEWRSQSPLKTN